MGSELHGSTYASYLDRQSPAGRNGDGAVVWEKGESELAWLDTRALRFVSLRVTADGADAGWTLSGTNVSPGSITASDIDTIRSGTVADGESEEVFGGLAGYSWVRLELDADGHTAEVIQSADAIGTDAARRYYQLATDTTQQAPQVRVPGIDFDAEDISSTGSYTSVTRRATIPRSTTVWTSKGTATCASGSETTRRMAAARSTTTGC